MSSVPAFISREQVGDLSILSFNISSSYEMPVALLTSHVSQFQTVLSFASRLIELENSIADNFKRDVLFSEYMSSIQIKHSQDILDCEKQTISDMSSKISPLVQQLSDLEKRNVENIEKTKLDYDLLIKKMEKEKRQIEEETNSIKAELETSHQKEIKYLRKQLSEKEAELTILSKSDSIIREQCKSESDRLIKAIEDKNKELLTMKENILYQREQVLIKKENELQSKIQRSQSSVLRGHDGEHFFANLAKEKMNWELIKAPTFSCDYSSTINETLTLFEIKNYTNAIPNAEINKFHRDMKMHPEALVGVFISLNTYIQGRNPSTPIAIDWINVSQCVIYIQSCADLDIDYIFSIIDQLIRISAIFNNVILSKSSSSQDSTLESRIEQAKTYLERAILRGTKLIKKISADKKQQIEFIESSSSASISEIKYQNADLTTCIQTLLGTDAEDDAETKDPIVHEVQNKKSKRSTSKKVVST